MGNGVNQFMRVELFFREVTGGRGALEGGGEGLQGVEGVAMWGWGGVGGVDKGVSAP